VSEALTHLQAQTGAQADLVMGIIHDNRLNDKAQVILIVTGLGATAIEEVLPGLQNIKTPEPEYQPELAYIDQVETDAQPMPLSMSQTTHNNLDIPAFLRRRRS